MITIGLLIRNSTMRQVGNFRSEAQADLAQRIQQNGYGVRLYDEQGTSGAELSKRRVTLQMLDDLKRNVIQGIAAYDVKRLTRDEFGIDGATLARRIVEAGGLFLTFDREYNLRNDDDLLQFQFQCFIAGIDWRNIRNTLWSGIFKKLEQEPVYMKTPLGYMTATDAHDKKHVQKNPAHEHVLAELARLFDECESLAEVVRTLNTHGPQRPAFRGRGGTSSSWHMYGLRYILRNPIYVGVFSFGTDAKHRSTVWDKFALDPITKKPKDFLQHRPELAYWEPAQVRRWQRKFAKPANARVMRGLKSRHPLLGVLDCVSCGNRMIGHGLGTYACSAVGTGRGRKGFACLVPQLLRENAAMQILRHELPRALRDAQDIAESARAQLTTHAPSPTAQRLAFLEDRVQVLGQKVLESDSSVDTLVAAIKKADAEIAELRDRVADEEDARLADEDLAKTCELLLNSPVEAFDRLTADKQARVYTLLFAGVRIETSGFASGRRWRLQRYVARLGDDERITTDAPWGYLPNPMAKLAEGQSRSALIFETAGPEQTLASRISLHGYTPYLPSVRELAGVFAGAGSA
jgi:hypothetical protein